jgi:hypothetical protein
VIRYNYRASSAVVIGFANTRFLQNSKFASHGYPTCVRVLIFLLLDGHVMSGREQGLLSDVHRTWPSSLRSH